MLRSLISGTAAVLLLASTSAGALAMQKGGEEDMADHRSHCESLLKQFDAANTTNGEALSLRSKAGKNCADAAKNSVFSGEDQIQQALKMIGVEPL